MNMGESAILETSGSYLLDTNVIDSLLASSDLCEVIVRASVDLAELFYVTHIAIDEIQEITTDRHDRRMALLQVLAKLPADRIATSLFVLDVSRLGEAKLSDDGEAGEFSRLTGGNERHTQDAILSLTAKSIGATLVSEDKDLRRMARQLEIGCLKVPELRSQLVTRLGSSN